MNGAGSWAVSVPASSANLGAGFDVFGMAVTLPAEVGVGAPPPGAVATDGHHPTTIAFRRLGGVGPVWLRTSIPMGRGLGFSGAVRVGGAAAAVVQQEGPDALADAAQRARVLAAAADLEGHADNVAASLHGGVTIAVDGRVAHVPLAFDPTIVVWVPDSTTTSTDQSRARLPGEVSRADAVFNLGRAALFVAACATGDVAALRTATDDRLHQQVRLGAVPESARAIDAAIAAGAWAAWLSGSGPTVGLMCEAGQAGEMAGRLPSTGHTKILRIDHEGAIVTRS